MKLGFSGEMFGNLLLLLGMIMFISIVAISVVAHKKSINITSKKFMLSLSMGAVILFILIPLWFTDLVYSDKAMITIVAIVVGISNYFAIDKAQSTLKDYFEKKK